MNSKIVEKRHVGGLICTIEEDNGDKRVNIISDVNHERYITLTNKDLYLADGITYICAFATVLRSCLYEDEFKDRNYGVRVKSNGLFVTGFILEQNPFSVYKRSVRLSEVDVHRNDANEILADFLNKYEGWLK